MNRRLGIGTIAIATLVLLAGCSAPLQTTNSDPAFGDAHRTISTTGNGEVSTEADRAVVTIAVTARADSAEEARSTVAADATAMREALRAAGVDDDAVTTAAYHVRPISEPVRESGEREVTGYEAVHAYRIETTPDAAGTVVDTAVGNGASEVHGVSFTLSEETRAELREEALDRAMGSARADAQAIASSAGLTVTGVQSASTSDGYGPAYAVRETAADSGGAPTQFEGGSVTVTANVEVTFTAEEQ